MRRAQRPLTRGDGGAPGPVRGRPPPPCGTSRRKLARYRLVEGDRAGVPEGPSAAPRASGAAWHLGLRRPRGGYRAVSRCAWCPIRLADEKALRMTRPDKPQSFDDTPTDGPLAPRRPRTSLGPVYTTPRSRSSARHELARALRLRASAAPTARRWVRAPPHRFDRRPRPGCETDRRPHGSRGGRSLEHTCAPVARDHVRLLYAHPHTAQKHGARAGRPVSGPARTCFGLRPRGRSPALAHRADRRLARAR